MKNLLTLAATAMALTSFGYVVETNETTRTYGGEVTVNADLTSGATLQLDCDSDYRLLGLTVDGTAVTSRNHLTEMGVNVTGSGLGRVRIGPKSGLMLMLR